MVEEKYIGRADAGSQKKVQDSARAVEVKRLAWPQDGQLVGEARRAGVPLLLMVSGSDPAPVTDSPIEDWIRMPAPRSDVMARIEALRRAAIRFPSRPLLDAAGVLTMGGITVTLAPVEALIMRELVERFGAVVGRDQLSRAAWGSASAGRNALDVHILRIRRRLAPLPLELKTVRSRGYLLVSAAS